MADNIAVQSATPATLPDATILAAAEVSFSGQTAIVGLGAPIDIVGVEGSRTGSLMGRVKSGAMAVPLSATAVTNFGGSTAYLLDVVLVNNATSNAIAFGLTDGADASLMVSTSQIPGRTSMVFPYYGLEITGLKCIAGASGLSVRAQGRTAI